MIVTRSAVEPISPDQEFPVVLSLENAGNTTMESVVASVSTSDSLILQNNTSTFVIKQIAPGKTEKLPLKLKAGKELTGSTQSISVDLKYNYVPETKWPRAVPPSGSISRSMPRRPPRMARCRMWW